jgi:tetratricopeptide (TPR) repeat protein
MRVARASIVLVSVVLIGCRLPSRGGAIPQSLVASRRLCQQGVAAIERSQWQRAEELLYEAVKTCPFDPDARRHYAEVLWHQGKSSEAIAQMEEASQLAVDSAETLVRLARMRLEAGELERARVDVESALDLDPKSADAWATRAEVSRARGEAKQALADVHRALALAPDDRHVRLALARVYRESNQPERALAVLQRLAESRGPGAPSQQVFVELGLAYAALSRFGEAADSLVEAGARGELTAEVLCELGWAQWRAGRPEAAAAAARDALALDPLHQPSRELLSQLALAQNRNDAVRR